MLIKKVEDGDKINCRHCNKQFADRGSNIPLTANGVTVNYSF